MCTETIGEQLKPLLSSSAKPKTKKKPTAAKTTKSDAEAKAIVANAKAEEMLKQFAPVPGVEGKIASLPMVDPIMWCGRVLFRVPGGTHPELDNGKPVRITHKQGQCTLVISGDPEMLSAIGPHGALVQGNLVMRRNAKHPRTIASMTLVLGGQPQKVERELQLMPSIAANHRLAERGDAGWSKAVVGCVIRIINVNRTAEQQLAA